MSTFSDLVSLNALSDAFVADLVDDVGLATLFGFVYELAGGTLHGVQLAGIRNRRFQAPFFQTLRTSGSEDHLASPQTRVNVERQQPRAGRLAWIDIMLELDVSAVVQTRSSPLRSISSRDLMEELGEPATLEALRTELETRFGESVTQAFFEKLHVDTIEDFARQPKLFLDFVSEELPPFDPLDPANSKRFPLLVCFKLEPDLDIAGSLREARLCRSLLENERQHHEVYRDAAVAQPYAFVTVFPESAATDSSIPGRTADQVRTDTKNLFAAEQMAAHFAEGI